MIFITLGSQKFQFNRILEEVDRLIQKRMITEKVVAQIGACTYIPKYFEYQKFYDREGLDNEIDKADIIITHGGTGAIITSVKKGKKIIAVPRKKKYGEHVDDHQLEIIRQFDDLNLICPCYDVESLFEKFNRIREINIASYSSNTHVIIESIERYVEEQK